MATMFQLPLSMMYLSVGCSRRRTYLDYSETLWWVCWSLPSYGQEWGSIEKSCHWYSSLRHRQIGNLVQTGSFCYWGRWHEDLSDWWVRASFTLLRSCATSHAIPWRWDIVKEVRPGLAHGRPSFELWRCRENLATARRRRTLRAIDLELLYVKSCCLLVMEFKTNGTGVDFYMNS